MQMTPHRVPGRLPKAPILSDNKTCFLKSCRCFECAVCLLALGLLLLGGVYCIMGKATGKIPPSPPPSLWLGEGCPSCWDLASLPNSSVPWTFVSVFLFLSHSPDSVTHGFYSASSSPGGFLDTFLQLTWPNLCPRSRSKGAVCLDTPFETSKASGLHTGNN